MEDKTQEVLEQVEPAQKGKQVTALVVKNSDGKTFSTRLKDENGRFVSKKKRKIDDPSELKKVMRTLLTSAEAGPDGKMLKGTKHRWRKAFDALVNMASYDGELDEKGNRIWDPKVAMVAHQAQKLILAYAVGNPSKAPEELEAGQTQSIQVVVIQAPEALQPMPEKKELPNVPSFIDAEVVKQN